MLATPGETASCSGETTTSHDVEALAWLPADAPMEGAQTLPREYRMVAGTPRGEMSLLHGVGHPSVGRGHNVTRVNRLAPTSGATTAVVKRLTKSLSTLDHADCRHAIALDGSTLCRISLTKRHCRRVGCTLLGDFLKHRAGWAAGALHSR